MTKELCEHALGMDPSVLPRATGTLIKKLITLRTTFLRPHDHPTLPLLISPGQLCKELPMISLV